MRYRILSVQPQYGPAGTLTGFTWSSRAMPDEREPFPDGLPYRIPGNTAGCTVYYQENTAAPATTERQALTAWLNARTKDVQVAKREADGELAILAALQAEIGAGNDNASP